MKYLQIKHWGFFLILLFSIIPLMPLFHTGFFSMHDSTQVARVFEMGTALRDGMLPVRWSADLGFGYGYPMFTFYAPLAYYFGGASMLFGLSALTATKLMMGAGILCAGIFMYFFGKAIWGEAGGVVSGMLYLYAPYHALDIYVRGDVAEFWAYAFLPLVCLALWKSFSTKKVRFLFLGAVGFAGIILSHNLSALMMTPFLLVFASVLSFYGTGKKVILRLFPLLALILGLGLSAFYWLPVPFEMQYTNVMSQVGGSANYRDHFVCIQQLWNSPWGYGGSAPGCADGISFALGKMYIFLFVFTIILLPFIFRKNKRYGWLTVGAIIGALVSVFFLLSVSEPVWQLLRPMAFLQYPWRFLSLVAFFISVFGGAIFWLIDQSGIQYKKLINYSLLIVCSGILIVVQGKYFLPQTYSNVTSNSLSTKMVLRWDVSRITHEYMPKFFSIPTKESQVPLSYFAFPLKNSVIHGVTEKTQRYQAVITTKTSTPLLIYIAYFPAWRATLDGKRAPLKQTFQGMSLLVPAGTHNLAIFYESTPIEKLANFLSVASIFLGILVIMSVQSKKKK